MSGWRRFGLRVLQTGAAVALLTAAGSARAPNYYSYSQYYSDATYSQVVGGWTSCPPNQGGYTYWGQWTVYELHYENAPWICA